MSLSPEAVQTLAALGVELPEGASQQDIRTALAGAAKILSEARKALPKAPPVRFEDKERDGETETVLRVQRGGKGQPLVVNQHAAALLVECVDALRAFAETGEAQALPAFEPAEEGDEEDAD